MKRITAAVMLAMMIFVCSGCSEPTLPYNPNLGYSLDGVDHSDVVFNVYHSNTNDHVWERIASFSCTPEAGHYAEVRLEGSKDHIRITLRDNTYTEAEDGESAIYSSTEQAFEELDIPGFEGSIPGCAMFEIEDREGEQFQCLYPIANGSVSTYFGDVSGKELDLQKPYDVNGENLDNILVTITLP